MVVGRPLNVVFEQQLEAGYVLKSAGKGIDRAGGLEDDDSFRRERLRVGAHFEKPVGAPPKGGAQPVELRPQPIRLSRRGRGQHIGAAPRPRRYPGLARSWKNQQWPLCHCVFLPCGFYPSQRARAKWPIAQKG